MTSFAAAPALRDHWFAVTRAIDVDPGPLKVRLLTEDLVVWRGPEGVISVSPDRCPHREAPLSAGRVVDGCLECPYHGWRFADGGRCTLVPSSGVGAPVPPRAHLSSYHVQERYGLVWVCLGEPAADLPHMPQEDDPSFRRITTELQSWSTAATRMVDNFLDISHFPFVHIGTFGTDTDPVVAKIELESLGEFYGYQYEVEVTNQDLGRSATGVGAPVLTRRMSTGFSAPLTVRSTIAYETGLEHILLLVTTPCDDETSLFTFVVWRNDDFGVSAEDVIRLDRAVGAEDKVMLERIPGTLPLDATTLVSVQSDKPSVEWRRRFAALVGVGDRVGPRSDA